MIEPTYPMIAASRKNYTGRFSGLEHPEGELCRAWDIPDDLDGALKQDRPQLGLPALNWCLRQLEACHVRLSACSTHKSGVASCPNRSARSVSLRLALVECSIVMENTYVGRGLEVSYLIINKMFIFNMALNSNVKIEEKCIVDENIKFKSFDKFFS